LTDAQVLWIHFSKLSEPWCVTLNNGEAQACSEDAKSVEGVIKTFDGTRVFLDGVTHEAANTLIAAAREWRSADDATRRYIVVSSVRFVSSSHALLCFPYSRCVFAAV
jgi:hypothetical protein